MRDWILFFYVFVEDIGFYFMRYILVLVRIYCFLVKNFFLKNFFRIFILQIFDEISVNFGCFLVFCYIFIYRNFFFFVFFFELVFSCFFN